MELKKLKVLLGIKIDDQSEDLLLEFVIDNIKEIILNHCNLDVLPDGLISTCYRMCMDLYRNENLGSKENSLGSISSISEGDTSTNFRSSMSEFKDSILKDYKKQLNKYRKVAW
ncbi:phage head-tail connector protein [Clostridium butyricum]|uniref:phage head-tail connector protein n=1 Tax=Clostridium butyricum TaxID=1492 RepID=UPI002AB22E00|nr:phage head-tail connector protein [Clostridium butyricum]